MTPWAASESVTAAKVAPGGTVTRSGAALVPRSRSEPAAAARRASRRPPLTAARRPPRVEIVLEQHRRREGVHVLPAPAGAAALLPDGGQRPGRAHPLVPELHRQSGAARRSSPASSRAATALASFLPFAGERQAHDHARPAGARRPARGTAAWETACPRRRTSVSSGVARVWVSSLSARPMRTSPQSTASSRPDVRERGMGEQGRSGKGGKAKRRRRARIERPVALPC